MGVTVLSGPHVLAGEFVPQLFPVPYSSLSEPDVVQLGQLPPGTIPGVYTPPPLPPPPVPRTGFKIVQGVRGFVAEVPADLPVPSQQTIAGIPSQYLLIGGASLFLLLILARKGKRGKS